jgi:hypothetical protein
MPSDHDRASPNLVRELTRTYSERRFKHLAGSAHFPWRMNVEADGVRRRTPPLGAFKGFFGLSPLSGNVTQRVQHGSILRLGSPRAGYGREACMKRVLFALAIRGGYGIAQLYQEFWST